MKLWVSYKIGKLTLALVGVSCRGSSPGAIPTVVHTTLAIGSVGVMHTEASHGRTDFCLPFFALHAVRGMTIALTAKKETK